MYLLSILKEEIKDKINSDKTIFYTFNVLNAQFLKQTSHINMFN
jgi:hypothetical protein